MASIDKTYLGDGLYAKFDGYQIRLFASDGMSEHDEVFLDSYTLQAFLLFVKKVEEVSR